MEWGGVGCMDAALAGGEIAAHIARGKNARRRAGRQEALLTSAGFHRPHKRAKLFEHRGRFIHVLLNNLNDSRT